MKLIKLGLSAVIITAIVFFWACDKSDDDPEIEFIATVSGEWEGYLLMDDSEEELTAESSYILDIEQDIKELSGTLTIPDEFGFSSPITLMGTLDTDTTITMEGSIDGQSIGVSGIIEDDHSLQIAISGVADETQLVFLSKDIPSLVGAALNNTYKLELKLGTAGVGRSVILVHGMDDNSDSWNDMLDYFEDHNIDDNFNVWTFEYLWMLHIADNGQKMYEMIADKMFDEINEYPIIVAHSMGGLVARYYISIDSDSRYHHRLITLGTPHLGSGLASLAGIFDWANVTGVTDLAPGSNFLADLNSDSNEQEQHSTYWLLNGKVGTYFHCYAETPIGCIIPGYKWHLPKPPANIKAGHAALSKPNDGMVPQSSSRFYGDDDVHHVDSFEWVDHISLNKNRRVCEWVTDFIKEHPLN